MSRISRFGLVSPPRTPPEIAYRLSAAIAEALKQPAVAKRLADLSFEPGGQTPAEMAIFMRQEAERWGNVIGFAGVKVD